VAASCGPEPADAEACLPIMAKDITSPSGKKRNVALVRPFLASVLTLQRLAASDAPLQDFLDGVVAEVARATTISHIKILQYRPTKGDLLVVSGIGWHDGVIGKATLPIDISSPPGRVIQTGRSSLVEDFHKESDFKLSGLLKLHGIVSLLNVPIKADNAVWGVLETDSDKPCHFSEDLLTYLKITAHLIGTAVSRDQYKANAEGNQVELARAQTRGTMLLTEMHHRVKNNFQVIVSMLLLQSRNAVQDETHQVLRTMADRVMAIALAHDQLDPRQSAHTVSVSSYLAALCRTIGQVTENVAIETNLDEGALPVEDAVALGLILNELVANSLKHAFEDGGRVIVTFRAGTHHDEACLTVADNGKGMGAARPGSAGTSLIEALVGQLRGRKEQESSKRGTTVRIFLPMT
jgi:two-component sensor histidine kinase